MFDVVASVPVVGRVSVVVPVVVRVVAYAPLVVKLPPSTRVDDDHDVDVPSVVKYLFALLVWSGSICTEQLVSPGAHVGSRVAPGWYLVVGGTASVMEKEYRKMNTTAKSVRL